MPKSWRYPIALGALSSALVVSAVPVANAAPDPRTPRGGLVTCVVTPNDNWRHLFLFKVYDKRYPKDPMVRGQVQGWPDKQIGCTGAEPFRPGKYMLAFESATKYSDGKDRRNSWVTKVVRSGPTGKAVNRKVARKGQKMIVSEPFTVADKKTTTITFYNEVIKVVLP